MLHFRWNAARRVALYWKNRKEVFGDRAFLPLTLTGRSALKADEIAMVKTGYMAIMPDDQKGRPIYFHDLSRLTTSFTGMCSRLTPNGLVLPDPLT